MAIIWSWRHGGLNATEVDDNEWQRTFFWMSDGDDCSIDGVEVNGEYLDRDRARQDPEVKRLDAEAWDRARRSVAQANEYRTIVVRHPSKLDYWGAVDTVKAEDATNRVAELVEQYGAARVKIAPR